MSDKKHIDRLFQEGFKDFEATPSDAVWENIEAKLNQKKKKRRVIPIWWRYAGAAALLLLLLTIGGAYFNNTTEDLPTNHISETENTTLPNTKKDIPDDLNNAKETIANTNTDTNDGEGLNSDGSQQISNKINSSEESSIAEISASKNNNESKKDPNSLFNNKQETTNQILSNNAIAKAPEEKNDTEKIANKPKSNNAYSEENENVKSLQNNLKNGTAVASSSEKYNQATKQNSESSINKERTKDLINNNTSKNNNAIADNYSEENLQNTLKNNTTIASGSEKDNQATKQNNESLIDKKRAKDLINNASKDKNAIAKVEKETTETVINDESEKNNLTIEEAIEDKTKNIIEEEENVNRWSISPNAAPVYFNTLGEGSSIDPQFNSNSKSGELNMSYGIAASYAINKKLSVRSGINRVNLGYNTNNVVAFQSVGVSSSSRALQNVNSVKANNTTSSDNITTDNVSLVSGESFNSSDIPEAFSTSNTSINQDLGYIEIPLEIQYALSDKKLGVNLIGGFSSFFLSNNKIFSESENGTRTLLGKANNINKVSYSANFGLGLNYQVSKKIDLNLEPMFKYQINTFNNTSGDFKPFFIGVYTGFAIKF